MVKGRHHSAGAMVPELAPIIRSTESVVKPLVTVTDECAAEKVMNLDKLVMAKAKLKKILTLTERLKHTIDIN